MEYEKWLVDFGVRLRAERERQSLTRNALAQRIDTKQDYIAQMERGAKSPSMRTFLRLMLALDVSPDLLIAGTNIGQGNKMDDMINDFAGFLKKQDVSVVSELYEIVRFLTKYIYRTDAG